MLQILNRRARKCESKTMRSDRIDPESDDTGVESPLWTTRPSGYFFTMMDSPDVSAGTGSESMASKTELDEETETEWSMTDD